MAQKNQESNVTAWNINWLMKTSLINFQKILKIKIKF